MVQSCLRKINKDLLPQKTMKRKGQINFLDLLAGLIVIFGGALIFFSYSGLGGIFASIGFLVEAIKYVIINGAK